MTEPVAITPPNPKLNRRVKAAVAPSSGITRDEAIDAANAVLEARFDEARIELERRIRALRDDESRHRTIDDLQHGLLKSARRIADMAGTFGFHAVTDVGRSLEGYLLTLMGNAVVPDPKVVELHIETMNSLFAGNVRGESGASERLVVMGLHEVAKRSLAKEGLTLLPG